MTLPPAKKSGSCRTRWNIEYKLNHTIYTENDYGICYYECITYIKKCSSKFIECSICGGYGIPMYADFKCDACNGFGKIQDLYDECGGYYDCETYPNICE